MRSQTYLAGYFCVVDFSLLAQYVYYRSLHLPIASTPIPDVQQDAPVSDPSFTFDNHFDPCTSRLTSAAHLQVSPAVFLIMSTAYALLTAPLHFVLPPSLTHPSCLLEPR